ncbi:hypothetical protein GCM10009734_83330 [Nonomuraea bangladeshensis]
MVIGRLCREVPVVVPLFTSLSTYAPLRVVLRYALSRVGVHVGLAVKNEQIASMSQSVERPPKSWRRRLRGSCSPSPHAPPQRRSGSRAGVRGAVSPEVTARAPCAKLP